MKFGRNLVRLVMRPLDQHLHQVVATLEQLIGINHVFEAAPAFPRPRQRGESAQVLPVPGSPCQSSSWPLCREGLNSSTSDRVWISSRRCNSARPPPAGHVDFAICHCRSRFREMARTPAATPARFRSATAGMLFANRRQSCPSPRGRTPRPTRRNCRSPGSAITIAPASLSRTTNDRNSRYFGPQDALALD